MKAFKAINNYEFVLLKDRNTLLMQIHKPHSKYNDRSGVDKLCHGLLCFYFTIYMSDELQEVISKCQDKIQFRREQGDTLSFVIQKLPHSQKMSDEIVEKILEYLEYSKEIVLLKVIEFCRHHMDDPMPEIKKPLRSNIMVDNVSEWDANFIDIEQDVLFEILLASNEMGVKSLLDLSCAKVASMIKGKTPEEIQETFNIVDSFSPEEEARVREENKWCEES